MVYNSFANKQFQSQCLNDIRFLLSIALVLFHTFALNFIPGFDINNYLLTYEFKRWIDSFFCGDSIVAVYFFISGYLFFYNNTEWTVKVYQYKLRNRVKTLLIPYLLWNLIGIGLVVFKSLPIFDVFLSYPGTGIDLSISNLLSCFWMYNGKLSAPLSGVENAEVFVQTQSYPINTALWFVRDLMIVVVCTPLLHFLLKRLKLIILTVLGVAYVVFSYKIVDWHINQLTMAFLFFSWGAYLSIQRKLVLDTFKNYYVGAAILYLLCSTGYVFVSDYSNGAATLLKIIHSFALVLFSFGVVSYFLPRIRFTFHFNVMALSCFVYMSHCLVVPRILKILTFFIKPDTDILWLTVYLLSFILTLFLLALCFFFCKRYTPSLLNVLIGGRV